MTTITENDIRPDALMAGQAERFMNDVARLLERKSEFVEVGCPACGAQNSKHRFIKYEMNYVDCQECETMYISPRPTPAVLDYYYSNSENYAYWNELIFPASEAARRKNIFQPRAERLAAALSKFGVSRNMLLEVGSGFGTFAECARDLGLFDRIVAIEPTPDLAQTCRDKGFEVLESPFEHVDFSAYQASVVAAFEVIEHLFSPKEFFETAFKVLEPGGLVVVSCPNGKGFDVEMMQDLAGAVDVEHLNYFNPKSLSHLVESCGFAVLEAYTPGVLDVDLVHKKAVSGEIDLSGNAFLQKILLDEFDQYGLAFQRFLAENGLSGHLMLVARKPG